MLGRTHLLGTESNLAGVWCLVWKEVPSRGVQGRCTSSNFVHGHWNLLQNILKCIWKRFGFPKIPTPAFCVTKGSNRWIPTESLFPIFPYFHILFQLVITFLQKEKLFSPSSNVSSWALCHSQVRQVAEWHATSCGRWFKTIRAMLNELATPQMWQAM